MFIETILATSVITLLSLIGVVAFARTKRASTYIQYVVPAAIGVFLGVVFFELIPETLEAGGSLGSVVIATGFIGFYLLSSLLHTYHHHHDDDQTHTDDCAKNKASASMLLLGDTIHNFADGIVIATGFLVSPAVGIATTVGIALHEVPQEIAEFSVLLRAGYNKSRAALYNLLSATSVIVGALVTLLFASGLHEWTWVLTGLAAGNLLYIAASDMLPEVHGHNIKHGRVFHSLLATILGLVAITTLLLWSHKHFAEPGSEHEEMPPQQAEHSAVF